MASSRLGPARGNSHCPCGVLPAEQRRNFSKAKPVRILLVDDDDDVRDYTASVLEDAGYEVRVASRGEAAMQILAAGEVFDLLITDVVMPGWDGTELVRRVRSTRPDLRILYITGYTRHIALDRLGNDEVLDKPYQRDSLLHAVRHALVT
jgi:CheY-like chemotaxis protein